MWLDHEAGNESDSNSAIRDWLIADEIEMDIRYGTWNPDPRSTTVAPIGIDRSSNGRSTRGSRVWYGVWATDADRCRRRWTPPAEQTRPADHYTAVRLFVSENSVQTNLLHIYATLEVSGWTPLFARVFRESGGVHLRDEGVAVLSRVTFVVVTP